jgi:hypothetical protein
MAQPSLKVVQTDPFKVAQVAHVRESLARWLEGGAGRDAHFSRRRSPGAQGVFWCVELFDAHTCRASVLRADFDDALAHAIMIAEAE